MFRIRSLSVVLAAASLVVFAMTGPATASVVLYNQNFENPSGFVNDSSDVNIVRSINQLYGGQPSGFTFAQDFTVETLLITGNKAFGTGYSDPQRIGGNYTLGMLSTANNDLLGLSFNVQGKEFLNFRLNISSIDLSAFGGPFNQSLSAVPVFVITLFDNPSGSTTLSGNGTVLDFAQITGIASTSRSQFNWTEHTIALNASGSATGNVTVRIDLLNTLGSGYAAFDNFLIVASDTPGDVETPAVPEPASIVLSGVGLAALLVTRRRNRPRTASHVAGRV
jgi:hypothetical protein